LLVLELLLFLADVLTVDMLILFSVVNFSKQLQGRSCKEGLQPEMIGFIGFQKMVL